VGHDRGVLTVLSAVALIGRSQITRVADLPEDHIVGLSWPTMICPVPEVIAAREPPGLLPIR
jgi:hypothetical protein